MNRQFEPCNSPGVGRVGRTGRTLDSSQNGSDGHKGSRLAAWTSPDYVPDWSRTAWFERFRAAAWSGPFERFEPVRLRPGRTAERAVPIATKRSEPSGGVQSTAGRRFGRLRTSANHQFTWQLYLPNTREMRKIVLL